MAHTQRDGPSSNSTSGAVVVVVGGFRVVGARVGLGLCAGAWLAVFVLPGW